MSKYKKENSAVNKKESTTMLEVGKLPILAISERGITQDVCEHYGVRTEFSEVHGCAVAHYFPVTKKGKHVGYIKRDLIKPKKQAWSTVGNVDIDCELMGQSSCQDGGKKVFVTEGFYDVLSVYQALYDGWGRENNVKPNVVSVLLGAGNAAENIGNNLDFIGKFGTPVCVFDNDADGQDAVGAVSVLLGDMHNVSLPDNIKDPNELLLEDKKKLNQLCAFSKEYEPECISLGAGELDELVKPLEKGIYIPTLPKLMQLYRGLRPREMTVVLAPPKSGKTYLAKEINYQLLKMGIPTAGFYLEEDLVKTRQSFIARDNEVHLPVFRENPDSISTEQIKASAEALLDPSLAMFGTATRGHITPDKLIQSLRYCHSRGAKFGVVDHLSFVMSGMNSKNERQDIDKLLTDLAMFVRESGMHLIVIAHIKRKDVQPPKEKDGSIRFPYWQTTESSDGRGSGAFEQLCWNLWGISREIREDKQLVHTRVDGLLNREWGSTGQADVVTLDNHTGRLTPVSNYGFEEGY